MKQKVYEIMISHDILIPKNLQFLISTLPNYTLLNIIKGTKV